jgi:hypothetical protein
VAARAIDRVGSCAVAVNVGGKVNDTQRGDAIGVIGGQLQKQLAAHPVWAKHLAQRQKARFRNVRFRTSLALR